MIEKVLLIIITAVVSSAISYFFAAQTAKKSVSSQLADLKDEFMEKTRNDLLHHVAVSHQEDVRSVAKELMSEHVSICGGSVRLLRIERALVFLVTKAGGSPRDLELE
jgi:hypothetical protein